VLTRVLTGAAVLELVLGAWWFDHSRAGGPYQATAALGSLIMLAALGELQAMGGASAGRRVAGRLLGALWLALLVLPVALPSEVTRQVAGLALPLAAIAASLSVVVRLPAGPGPRVARLAGTLWFPVAYVGGMGCLVGLLARGALDYAVGVTLVAKSSDIGGYFAGTLFGRHKLAPLVSPKKTVEGAVGGVLLPAAVATLVLPGLSLGAAGGDGLPVTLPTDAPLLALYGAVIGALAIVSDLSESLLKRSCSVKDSGRFFGSSGGFLDLIDSLLLVGACALAYTAAVS
jgi:phosphatidate cytidylyltransferase